MNKKQTIRLNESQLRRIVSKSLKKVLNEANATMNQGGADDEIQSVIGLYSSAINKLMHYMNELWVRARLGTYPGSDPNYVISSLETIYYAAYEHLKALYTIQTAINQGK